MIPQTLLWVGLVVAWLVVLVPMLIARHPKVNTVTDATLKTRLLHRGGSAKVALRRKIRPPATAAATQESADPAFAPAAAAVDVDLDADKTVADLGDQKGDQKDEPADEFEEARAYVDSDVASAGDGPLDGDTTPIVTVQRAKIEAPERASQAVEPGSREAAQLELPDLDDGPSEPEPAVNAETDAAAVDDEIDADESLTEEVEPVSRTADSADADDERPRVADEVSTRRRGGFDPENDARISAARYRFRQRITIVLAVLAVVALGAGLMSVPYAWYALGALAIVLVGYLAYLRRTVQIETEIRRRRTARLQRARREREREAELVDGIPAHLRRYGAVVMEIDDEDPAFDHLPRYRSEEFDFLAPRSQSRSQPRETLSRKVG